MTHITDQERSRILGLYGITRTEKTPYQKLLECQFTSDGKYVIFEGRAYSCETGEQVPINEAWTLSDTLHTAGDLVSAGMDFIVPGSGAIIDTVNALSYIVEAQFKKPEERHSLYIMAAITFGFVLVPGVLQGIAIPLKRAIRTGRGMTSKVVKDGIYLVGRSFNAIAMGIPRIVNRALKSKLGQRVLGKWGPKITKILDDFISASQQFFTRYSGKAAVAVGSTIEKGVLKQGGRALRRFFGRVPKIRTAPKLFRKLGFVQGKSYKILTDKGTVHTIVIKEIREDAVVVTSKGFVHPTMNPLGEMAFTNETFLRNAVGTPWMRRGRSVMVPLFVKRLSDLLLPDGSDIDYSKIDTIPDMDPNITSQESLSYLEEEVSQYQGDTRQYSVQTNVTTFQNALQALGYTLPQYGVDGKFGPETQGQLKRFQTDNGLTSSLGKMDRITAKKLAEILQQKNISGSENLQTALNSI